MDLPAQPRIVTGQRTLPVTMRDIQRQHSIFGMLAQVLRCFRYK